MFGHAIGQKQLIQLTAEAQARTDGPSDLRPVSPSGPICDYVTTDYVTTDLRPVSPSGPICARRPWDQWCGKGESLACGKTTWGR